MNEDGPFEVLDASAMLALLRREPGWEIVGEQLADPGRTCYAHALNLAEVFYQIRRASGEAAAQSALQDLYALGVLPQEDMDAAFWEGVSRLKADLRRISLADCCGVALAQRHGAEFVTTDHGELDALVPLGICPLRFIR